MNDGQEERKGTERKEGKEIETNGREGKRKASVKGGEGKGREGKGKERKGHDIERNWNGWECKGNERKRREEGKAYRKE